jgi:aconitate decarboxylase
MKMNNSISANPTRALVDAAYRFNHAELPAKTRQQIQFLLCDGIGVLFMGMEHPTIRKLMQHFRMQHTHAGDTFPGLGLEIPVTDAAFVYGTSTHVLDFEPMFDPPTHAVSPVLGAIFALASQDSDLHACSGEVFLRAFSVGIALQAELREAARVADDSAKLEQKFFPFQKQGFHPPGTVGVMGSALASAILLGLSEDEACMALGMAASRACGIAANIGTATKATHSGNAARAGLECALLVKNGFTASRDTFAEPGGWGEVFGGDAFDANCLVEGMKSMRCFTRPGFAFKRWPAHTAMQVAIDAALQLHQRDLKFDGDLEIETPVFPYCNRPNPQSTDECRFSFQFNVVQAMLDGKVNAQSFSESQFQRSDIQRMLAKTRLSFDNRIPADFTQMEVRIMLSDGRKAKSNIWPGHWNSAVNENVIADKFLSCMAKVLPKAECHKLVDSLLGITQAFNLQQCMLALRQSKVFFEIIP